MNGDPPSLIDPAGPGAERIADLWWLMLWIAVAVFAVVVGFLLAALLRARRRDDHLLDERPAWAERFIVLAGVVIPAVILIGVFVHSLGVMSAVAGRDGALTIDVTGHYWWWEVVYEGGVVTANEIHIPVGEPVRVRLESADVVHSFWVPRLQAKTDMIPGRVNELWLQADRPGTYRGLCAEFCGLQHAKMGFLVIAEPRAAFDEWVAGESEDETGDPATAEGREVFLSSNCVGCHSVRGTTEESSFGPDLTHFGSRRTLAAAAAESTSENLARWIADPQDLKPGAKMPPTELTDAELNALVDYLEGLD